VILSVAALALILAISQPSAVCEYPVRPASTLGFGDVVCAWDLAGFSSEWSLKSLKNSLLVGGDIGVFRQAHCLNLS